MPADSSIINEWTREVIEFDNWHRCLKLGIKRWTYLEYTLI